MAINKLHKACRPFLQTGKRFIQREQSLDSLDEERLLPLGCVRTSVEDELALEDDWQFALELLTPGQSAVVNLRREGLSIAEIHEELLLDYPSLAEKGITVSVVRRLLQTARGRLRSVAPHLLNVDAFLSDNSPTSGSVAC